MNTNFTQDQLNAFDVFCKGRNILLTGAAGTGKTLLIREMIVQATIDGQRRRYSCSVISRRLYTIRRTSVTSPTTT